LHWLSRDLIASGLVIFSVAAFVSAGSTQQPGMNALRITLIALGALALIAAIDEVLPDDYRSSTALLIVAGLIGFVVLALVFLVARQQRQDR
jgi:hypothetical protein